VKVFFNALELHLVFKAITNNTKNFLCVGPPWWPQKRTFDTVLR